MITLPRPVDVLPHRPPFLFVDELVRLQPSVSAAGTWRLTGDEWFFAGHFPARPTLPGVLMCEAIAQVGAIAVLTDDRFAGKLPLFGGLDGARFRRQVVPGDTLWLEVELARMSARAGKGTGRALVGGPDRGRRLQLRPPLRRRRRVTRIRGLDRHASSIGLVGAVVLFVGISLLFAFEQPPFVAPDETAHVGYAHEIANLDLPEITKPPDVPDSAVQWQAERESGRDDRYRDVWVANHPPLHYVAAAPLIWVSNAIDRPDGGLMFLRLGEHRVRRRRRGVHVPARSPAERRRSDASASPRRRWSPSFRRGTRSSRRR